MGLVRSRRGRIVTVIVLAGVLSLAWSAFLTHRALAADGEDKDLSEMNTEEVLEYISGPGINSAVGIAWSVVVGLLPGFGSLGPKAKRMTVLFFCLAIPIGATIGLWQMNGTPEKTGAFLTELWDAVVAGLTAFSTSQIAHTRKL